MSIQDATPPNYWEFTPWDVCYVRAMAEHFSNPPEPKCLLPQEIMTHLRELVEVPTGIRVTDGEWGNKRDTMKLGLMYQINSLEREPKDRDSFRPRYVLINRYHNLNSAFVARQEHSTLYSVLREYFLLLCTEHYITHMNDDGFNDTLNEMVVKMREAKDV